MDFGYVIWVFFFFYQSDNYLKSKYLGIEKYCTSQGSIRPQVLAPTVSYGPLSFTLSVSDP